MALTKTEAKILAYVYERGWVEDFKISRYIAVRESHLQTLLGSLTKRRYLKRDGTAYKITSKGQIAARRNPDAIEAQIELAYISAKYAPNNVVKKMWLETANELAAKIRAKGVRK